MNEFDSEVDNKLISSESSEQGVEFSYEEAELAGAFREDAISLEDVLEDRE